MLSCRLKTVLKHMAHETAKPAAWLSSDETRKQLRISSCELMHMREAGHLPFKKQGNAFLYSAADVGCLRESGTNCARNRQRVDADS
jgi:hypothetical protein